MTISIIIPVFNGAQTIERCLNSIFAQHVSDDIEVIVVNDCSTDNTSDLLNKITPPPFLHNLTIVNLSENLRQGGARNIGIKAAKGDFIQFLDADDTLLDNSLTTLIGNIKSNPSLDILFFDSVTQEESSNRQLAGMNYQSNHSNIISGEEYLLKQQVPWVPWMAVYRRAFLQKNHLRFAERVRFEDSDFVMESVLLAQRVQYIPLPVVCYRINGKSTSNIGSDAVKIEERILSAERLYKLIEQHADAYPNGTIIIRGQYQYKFRAILQRNLWRLDYNTIIRLLASYPYRLTPCDDTFITFTMRHKKLYAAAAAIFGPLLKSALHMRSIITKIKE